MTSTGPSASASTSSPSSSSSSAAPPSSSKPRSFPLPSRSSQGPAFLPQPRGGKNNSDDAWKSALTRYAKSPDPASLPAEEVLHWDEQTITIYDGYEKAKHHFLCLPRIPFRLKAGSGKVEGLGKEREERPEQQTPPLRVTGTPQKGGADSSNWRSRGTSAPSASASTEPPKPTLSAAGGKLAFGTSSKNATGTGAETVPPLHLASLSDLLRSPYAGEVLAALEKAAHKTAGIVKERMPSTLLGPSPLEASAQPPPTATATVTAKANCTWDVHIGFHAVPSMDTVHLHVISSDLVAERLRHKKHYLSFHPHLGFWLPLGDVLEMQRKGKKTLPRAPHYYERLLRGPLVPLDWTPTSSSSATQGGMAGAEAAGSFRTMPELKRYLEKRWLEEIRARQTASRGGADDVSAFPATGSQAGEKEADALRQPLSSKRKQASHESETESETESEGRDES